MTAASVTRGSVLTASMTSRENTTLCCHSNLLFGSEIVMVRTLCESNPGATARRCAALLNNSPAQTRSTIVNATCDATSRSSARFCRCPEPGRRALSERTDGRSLEIHAGVRPVRTAVATPIATATARTKPLTPTRCTSGTPAGNQGASSRIPADIMQRPTAVDAAAISNDSTRNNRTIWRRLAPSAERTEISRCRARPRESSSVDTLPQAIPNTSAVASNNQRTTCCVRPRICALSGTTRTVQFRFVDGNASASVRDTASISAWACARVTPGRSLATTSSVRSSRRGSSARKTGSQKST